VLLLLVLVPLVHAGCGGGAPRDRPPEVILRTEHDDVRVGEEAAEQVGGSMGLIEDPELAGYVNAIGQRLAHYAPRGGFRYSFQIVDQEAPNAFALPGGFIYVSRGLLILSNSEQELAGVIGHEIIHVAARHAAARQSVMRGLPGPLQFMAMGYIAGFGRDQEREADRLGQGLAGLAGYDPHGLASFLQQLNSEERLQLGMSRLPGWLDSHPATAERVASASSRADMVAWQPKPGIAANRAEYLARIDGLIVGTAASEGAFQGDRFIHPDMRFTIRFPPGWTTLNTRQAVGAVAPKSDAMISLEHQGRGDDPAAAAQQFLSAPSQRGIGIDKKQPVKLGGLAAYRAEGGVSSRGGPIHVQFTWVAYRGSIFRITGFAQGRRYEGSLRSVPRTFRPLPPDWNESIQERRLRVVSARSGESLQQLSARASNTWNLQQTAVMNGIFADARLEAGQLVKVAVAEQYTPSAVQ
jgi:predicted Zn-dependent protease